MNLKTVAYANNDFEENNQVWNRFHLTSHVFNLTDDHFNFKFILEIFFPIKSLSP